MRTVGELFVPLARGYQGEETCIPISALRKGGTAVNQLPHAKRKSNGHVSNTVSIVVQPFNHFASHLGIISTIRCPVNDAT